MENNNTISNLTLNSNPNPLTLSNPRVNPVQYLSASLDLSGQPAGNYYFNKENNYKYTKNSFNYTQFQIVNENTVINEVVQGSEPDLVTNTLDLSKTYQLPSTYLYPDFNWPYAAKIEGGYTGFSGVDASGNTYVLANYDPPGADFYDSYGDYLDSLPNVGVITLCLTCYNSDGLFSWVSQIETSNPGDYVAGFYCITDNQGKTFILGTSSGTVIFRDASGNILPGFTVDISGKTFIVAYNSDGTPDWVTYFLTGTSKGYLIVDNQDVENVYTVVSNPYGISEFYDGIPINPTLMMTVPPSNLILAKFRASSGLFQWVTLINGYRLDTLEDWSGLSNQSGICDPFGNIFLTGYYTQMNPLVQAATPTDSSLETVWIPYESNRDWSAVDLNLDGSVIVATVKNGLVYICRNKQFETWEPVAEARDWSSVFCSGTGYLIIATEYNGKIYRSIDYGNTWTVTGGEGANDRAWNSITGSLYGDQLVATVENGEIYYSSDYGENWTISDSITADWVDVAATVYDDLGPQYIFIALIQNGSSYYSLNGGMNWMELPTTPTKDWSAIAGSRISSLPNFIFYVTAKNGEIYGIDYFGDWTLLDTNIRNWSDIAVSSNSGIYTNLFATVFTGEIYQSQYTSDTVWNPTTTIQQDWNRVAVSQGNLAVATVEGGRIYISTALYTPFETSSITVPPYSNPVIWSPRESNRNWSATDLNQLGNIMVATVEDGYIYISQDYGVTWEQRATIQNWSSVYCNSTGNLMIATVYDSVIYRSEDYGNTWTITGGEGSNAKHWNAITGTNSGDQLVATVVNDQIYYSTDFGENWNTSDSIIAEWVDVAYDQNNNIFIALIKNGGAYYSVNGGINWKIVSSSPTLNWSAITGSRYATYSTIIKYPFLATVENGRIYGIQMRMEEPLTMTSNTTPGGYVANSSSGSNSYQAFDNNYFTFWESASEYDDITGIYTGFETTTVDGNPVNGEWIQIQIPSAITLKEFVIMPRSAFESFRSPQDFTIAGSNDGVNWTQVCSFSGQTYIGFIPKTFIIPSPIPIAFTYFRLITTVVGGGENSSRTSINIVQWTLNFDFIWNELENINRDWTDIAIGTGTGDYSSIFGCVNNGSIFQTIYDSDIWTPTTTPYNWNTISMSTGDVAIATVKGGQIYTSENFYPRQHTFLVKYNPEGVPQWANYVNCPTTNEADNIGMSLAAQPTGEIILSGMVLNNNGGSVECFSPNNYTTPVKSLNFTQNIPPTMLSDATPPGYEVSASTFYFYLYVPYRAFDNNPTTFWHSAPFQYDIDTGEYIGSNSTIVNGNPVFGEWLQIQLREHYILTQFTITPRNDVLYDIRSPENFIVAGSNDNINWIQLCSFTGQTYIDFQPKLFVISNPIQTAFKYFRIITTVVGGGGFGFDRDSVQIAQWTFQGDGISNADRFIACYSNDGLPLWVNRIQMQTGSVYNSYTPQVLSQIKSIATDTFGNIYCFGYCSDVSFYNPTGQKVYTDDLISSFFVSINTAILIKYYPDGSFQSCARLVSFGNCYGNSIRVINDEIYVSGFVADFDVALFACSSDYSFTPFTDYYYPGIFVMKYLSDDYYPPFEFPSPGYPEVLQTRLTIGGSIRKLMNGYIYDGPVEIWGGQTGFTPGTITLEDANNGVVAHLGHEPGYLNRLNINEYHYLTVKLTEPSFPINDPQPVTPGTIPYGFLPIYILAPETTTALMFNTDYVNPVSSNTDALLYAAGSESVLGTFFSGVSSGDIIRLMIIAGVSSQYVTLQVKGFIVSAPDIPAAIVFEEPVSYLQAVIGGVKTSSSMLITSGDKKCLSSFIQPALIRSGVLQVCLENISKDN